MKTMTRLAALALVSSAATACEGFNIAGGGDECYTQTVTEKRVHTYDTRGQLARLEIYANGEPSVVFRYEYDREGRRVESRRYHPTALDKPVLLERVTLDPEGRLLRSEYLSPAGGLLIGVTRDERGRPVHSEIQDTPPSDEVAGQTYVSVTNAVDPNPLEGEGDELVTPAPGEVATLLRPMKSEPIPARLDELPTSFQAIVWSLPSVDILWSDAPVEPTQDNDGDGSPDAVAYQVVIATETTREDRWDFNGDGVADARRLVTFGAAGEPVESTSWDETATPPRVDEHIVYGEAETVTTTGDKVMRIVYEDGHRVLHTDDLGGDGTIDWEKTYTYDAEGRRTREDLDRNVDGRPDQTWTYTYDETGRLVQEDMEDGNGFPCSPEP